MSISATLRDLHTKQARCTDPRIREHISMMIGGLKAISNPVSEIHREIAKHDAQRKAENLARVTSQGRRENEGNQGFKASESRAKATEGKAGMAGVTGPVRRSTAGTGLRVGAAGAALPATSEFMDVTGRRDAHPISELPAKSGSDGTPTTRGLEVRSGGSQPIPSELDANAVRSGVTAGETAPLSHIRVTVTPPLISHSPSYV